MSLTLYVTLIVCSSLIKSDGFKFAWRRPGVSHILKEEYMKEISRTGDQLDSAVTNPPSQFNIKHSTKSLAVALLCPFLLFGVGVGSSSLSPVYADDELARYAAEGNKVGVDGQCFMRQCALETATCANDPNCLKGLSCLARCKGGSLCSTGCFAKYGSDQLNELLSCSVERHDCVHVPGKDSAGWTTDKLTDLPSMPLRNFDIASLDGSWYKVMGLDTRYDCFDCQMNSFQVKDANTLKMEAMFRIPRPTKTWIHAEQNHRGIACCRCFSTQQHVSPWDYGASFAVPRADVWPHFLGELVRVRRSQAATTGPTWYPCSSGKPERCARYEAGLLHRTYAAGELQR